MPADEPNGMSLLYEREATVCKGKLAFLLKGGGKLSGKDRSGRGDSEGIGAKGAGSGLIERDIRYQ
jgi:hypothetical protein